MSTSNNIRHGDPIADIKQSKLPGGEQQAFPTRQFQEFLDELDNLFNETGVSGFEQNLSILESLISSKTGALRNLHESQNRKVSQEISSVVSLVSSKIGVVTKKHESDFNNITQLFYSLVSENARLKAIVNDFKPVRVVNIAPGDTAYTTSGNEIIICNNTAALSITLNLTPVDNEKITVIRKGASVSLIGTLNGSTPTAIPSVNDVLDVYFTTAAAGGWSA